MENKGGPGLIKTNKKIEDSNESNSSLERFGSASPYIVLGVSEKATAKEIITAFRKLVLEYHPDVSKLPETEARKITQYLIRAFTKLVSKEGSLLKYNPEKDTDKDEGGFDWDLWDIQNFGDINVSDEEWYAGDKYWEILNEAEKARYTNESLKNEKEAEEERAYVLKLFANPEYGLNEEDQVIPTWDDNDKYREFYKARYGNEDVVKRHKLRIYNSKGKIVFGAGMNKYNKFFEGLEEKEFKEKNPIFYHGTVDNSIEELTPHSSDNRPTEKPAVYASPYMDIAVQSMANKFVSNGGIVNGRKFVCIPMGKDEFLNQDHGGTIYMLPNNSFNLNHDKGFGEDKEWISTEPVKPKDKIKIPSLYNALIEKGIEIYFIKPEMIPIITEAQNRDPEKLEEILANMKTEN